MKSYWTPLLFCAFLGLSGPANAAGFLYDCTITKKGARVQWLSDKLAFVVPGDGKIQVIDAVTLYFKISPKYVKVSRNTDTKLVMRWSLKGVRDFNGVKVPTFDYTARLNKVTKTIVLEASPRDFRQSWVGRGSCVMRTV